MLFILITFEVGLKLVSSQKGVLFPTPPLSPPNAIPANSKPELGQEIFVEVPTSPRIPQIIPPPPPLIMPPPPPPQIIPPPPPLVMPPPPPFVVPSAPFWEIDDIPILMDRFVSVGFDRIPPHVLRRIRQFCRQFPAHTRCRKNVQKLPPATATKENTTGSFPQVPKIPQTNVLVGVPQDLVAESPHFAFQKLKSEDREALLKACSGAVKCQEQDEASTKKRERIGEHELAVAKKISASRDNLENEIELRLLRTQQVKNSLFQFAGIAEKVVPTDDGTFQNDVLLTVKQSNYLINAINNPESRQKRQSLFLDGLPSEKWDVSSPIKYVFDSSLEAEDREVVMAALHNIESQTCVGFELADTQPSTPHLFYVKVAESELCGLSYIGQVDTVNPIYLSFACNENVGTAIHETLHALGVNHEQLRSDRDDYITINWENINPKQYDYFAVADMKLFTSYGVSYDYYSIMHYGPNTGGVDPNKPTIIPKYQSERFLKVIGQRKGLSDKDVELLTAMYCSKGCKDNNVYCGIWALKRLCAISTQQTWMQNNCKKSCGMC